MTKSLIRSGSVKSKLYKKWRKGGDETAKSKYKLYQIKLRKLLTVAERTHYFNKFQSLMGDPNKLLGSILNKRKPDDIANLFVFDGATISSPTEIVQNFNNYFVMVSSDLATRISPSTSHFSDYIKKSYQNILALFLTDASEIVNIVINLKDKMSSGVDEIPIMVLKSTIFSISEPLSVIVNCSMQTGVFPDGLKIEKIRPIL